MEPQKILAAISKKQHRLEYMPCPKCGKWRMSKESPFQNAMSRDANIQICDVCGNLEGYEAMLNQKTPLAQWYAVEQPEKFLTVEELK